MESVDSVCRDTTYTQYMLIHKIFLNLSKSQKRAANTVVRESAKFELARLKKEEEEETDFGGLATFWRGTFAMVIHNTGSLLGQENTRR